MLIRINNVCFYFNSKYMGKQQNRTEIPMISSSHSNTVCASLKAFIFQPMTVGILTVSFCLLNTGMATVVIKTNP